MGARLIALAVDHPGLRITAAVENNGHSSMGRDAGEASGGPRLGVTIQADIAVALSTSDVVVDFTTPSATTALIPKAVAAKTALVIGTTGLGADAVAAIRRAVAAIPIVYAPNMSLGMNVMFKVIADVTRALGAEYDLEIIEAHHRQKRDAPSGTALKLGEILADATERRLDEVAVYARHGELGPRAPTAIGIQAIRAGDIVGDHTVLFGGPGERLEITHRASSRDTFASGALRAAQWVAGKPAGLYDMQDVLGLK